MLSTLLLPVAAVVEKTMVAVAARVDTAAPCRVNHRAGALRLKRR
jgi:hypothetical protein